MPSGIRRVSTCVKGSKVVFVAIFFLERGETDGIGDGVVFRRVDMMDR